jgi:hypothetical protein
LSQTTFTNGVTLTDSDWFQDVDTLTYIIFGDSTTTASAAARLAPSFNNLTVAGTLSVSAQATLAGLAVGGALSVSAQATMAGLTVGGVLSATAIAGAVIATQAQMESAASTDAVVTPLRLHFHPAAAKAWARFDGTATSVTAAASYNVSSITDVGTGQYQMNFTTQFSSNSYIAVASSNVQQTAIRSLSAASATVLTRDNDGTLADAATICVVAYGDL